MKSLAKLGIKDPHYETMIIGVKEVNAKRVPIKWSKQEHYALLKSLELPKNIPEKIREQYDVALSLAMYALFDWRFWDVAAHKALNCYELALRTVMAEKITKLATTKIEKKKLIGKTIKDTDYFVTLTKVLEEAKKYGYIDSFEYNQSNSSLRKIRNSFSHEYSSLLGFPLSEIILRTCFNLICSVYANAERLESRIAGTGED